MILTGFVMKMFKFSLESSTVRHRGKGKKKKKERLYVLMKPKGEEWNEHVKNNSWKKIRVN